MLVQFVTALQGVLGPALLTMAYSVLLSPGSSRKKPASAYVRLLGLVLGILAALVFAGMRAMAVINRRTMINLPTLWACVIVNMLSLGLVICASSAVHNGKQHPQLMLVLNAVAGTSLGLTIFRALPDVILQLTNFVEPGAPMFTSDMLLRALGFLLGCLTAVLVACIFRSLRATSPQITFTVSSCLLLALIIIQQVTALAAVLQNSGNLVLHGTAFRLMAYLYNAKRSLTIAQVGIFLLPALGSVVAGYKMPLQAPDLAQVRIYKAFRRKAIRGATWSLLAVIAVTTALTVGVQQAYKQPVLSPPEAYARKADHIVIPLSQIGDGHLHRFEYKAKDGTLMRFIVIKKNGGAYGVGLDACENCGSAGYYERDGKIICKRCDVAINIATIGYKGGCNPIPFAYTTAQGNIVIQTSTLDALSSVFQG